MTKSQMPTENYDYVWVIEEMCCSHITVQSLQDTVCIDIQTEMNFDVVFEDNHNGFKIYL